MQRSAWDCVFCSAPAIYSRFLHISDERHRARLINKSLVCTKFYLFIRLVKSLEFIDRKMSILSTFCCQHGIKFHREKKKLYKNCNPYFFSSCQDTIRLD